MLEAYPPQLMHILQKNLHLVCQAFRYRQGTLMLLLPQQLPVTLEIFDAWTVS